MQKNILRFTIISALLVGAHGCSCSQSPAPKVDQEPGLYLEDTVSFEEGATPTVNVTLVREGEADGSVTVEYEIIASTSTSKALATVSSASDADVASGTGSLTFSATTSNKLSIPLTITNDTTYELDEVFSVKLTSASGASIKESQVEVTLLNDDSAPTASVELVDGASAELSESSYQTTVGWKVSLDVLSEVDATMVITSSVESGTTAGAIAAYRIDYMLLQNEVILPSTAILVIPAGEQEAFFELEVIDDGFVENEEDFLLDLSAQSHVKITTDSSFNFSITDNDGPAFDGENQEIIVAMKLNDTGVDDLPVLTLTEARSAQADKNQGLDSLIESTVKVGGGRASFDFSKIASDGTVKISDSFEDAPWDCVKDNNTGLLWEVKLDGAESLRGEGRRFSWYDPSYATNGGNAGNKGHYYCDSDRQTPPECSTAYYVADMNRLKLCGKTGWRLPTLEELRSIADYNDIEVKITGPNDFITSTATHYDTDYFAGDTGGKYYIWTSTSVADNPERAWTIKFEDLLEAGRDKSLPTNAGVRLVNDSDVKNAQ